MGLRLCRKEQSGRAAEGPVPFLATPTPFLTGAFLVGPEPQGAAFISLSGELITAVANKRFIQGLLT